MQKQQELVETIRELSLEELDQIIGAGKKVGDGIQRYS
ncbi:type A2 lanthipeptide [Streptococcus saliviloxodontae]|uniref:Lantibiotic n=1 Tax=Streptococcus saliviloxodontae TaxID=1349416 RepID=A0ABS2PLL9_9STRE|nr:type A2 lanthipeptide [Streptococcus saliviloxodontae]MBM7636337.1 hypothetical protein [Streptococcus saliviloxodontae]